MATAITSTANPRVKELLRLSKRSARDARRVTLVEGGREARRALEGGVTPVEAWACPELAAGEDARAALAALEALDRRRATHLFTVPPEVFARLAVREESGGVLLVAPYVTRPLAALPLRDPALIAVIEGVEKPGNLGTILRTADAAGVDAVIVAAGATDIHNPNVVRASLGTLFTVNVAEAGTDETAAWLRARGIRSVAATPEADALYTDADLRGPVALVLGAEAQGLSAAWRRAADLTVRIPMRGRADSLNLAVSAALLLYEAVRQRGA